MLGVPVAFVAFSCRGSLYHRFPGLLLLRRAGCQVRDVRADVLHGSDVRVEALVEFPDNQFAGSLVFGMLGQYLVNDFEHELRFVQFLIEDCGIDVLCHFLGFHFPNRWEWSQHNLAVRAVPAISTLGFTRRKVSAMRAAVQRAFRRDLAGVLRVRVRGDVPVGMSALRFVRVLRIGVDDGHEEKGRWPNARSWEGLVTRPSARFTVPEKCLGLSNQITSRSSIGTHGGTNGRRVTDRQLSFAVPSARRPGRVRIPALA